MSTSTAADRLTRWECLPTVPGDGATDLSFPPEGPAGDWLPAEVPGTVASALRAAGRSFTDRLLDADEVWFRTSFDEPPGGTGFTLHFGGLATIADVWLDGRHVLHSDNMFIEHDIEVDADRSRSPHVLLIRFRALTPLLAARRPRPRWKVARLASQNLRWVRTTLLGRLIGWVPSPPPTGPWRPVLISAIDPADVVDTRLTAEADRNGSADGVVTVDVTLRGPIDGAATVLLRGPLSGPDAEGSVVARTVVDIADGRVSGTLRVPDVQLWWPHTHGSPNRYRVECELAGRVVDLGTVAFRTVRVDRSDGGFAVSINGVPVFCRGACWTPLDPVSIVDEPAELRAAIEQVQAANLNMLRVSGETTYPSDDFLDLLDEHGILLWQDCMFAFYDMPADDALADSIELELRQVFRRLHAHPCLTVLSRGSELEQQAALVGIPTAQRDAADVVTRISALVEELLPGVPYVASSPTGGELAIQPRTGVAHYYGVGAYLRDLPDARRSNVRFAAECLAFATPPEPQTVERDCGGAARAGHHPAWKAAVYRDAGAPWDFEDVRDHYVRQLFRVDPLEVRWTDPERALQLGRAAVAELFESTWSEWRRTGSRCAGGVVFHYRDLAAGAGLGIVDSLGRPKAPWYVMRRLLAPISVLITDEGLNGLDAHLCNDTGETVHATLRVQLYAQSEVATESADLPVVLEPRARVAVDLTTLFDGFRDLSWAHRFGPPAQDVVAATLLGTDGTALATAVHLVGTRLRPMEADLGLTARAEPVDDRRWRIVVATRRLAQWVSVDVAGFVAEDSWFHLPPGNEATTIVHGRSGARPRGWVHALNAAYGASVALPS